MIEFGNVAAAVHIVQAQPTSAVVPPPAPAPSPTVESAVLPAAAAASVAAAAPPAASAAAAPALSAEAEGDVDDDGMPVLHQLTSVVAAPAAGADTPAAPASAVAPAPPAMPAMLSLAGSFGLPVHQGTTTTTTADGTTTTSHVFTMGLPIVGGGVPGAPLQMSAGAFDNLTAMFGLGGGAGATNPILAQLPQLGPLGFPPIGLETMFGGGGGGGGGGVNTGDAMTTDAGEEGGENNLMQMLMEGTMPVELPPELQTLFASFAAAIPGVGGAGGNGLGAALNAAVAGASGGGRGFARDAPVMPAMPDRRAYAVFPVPPSEYAPLLHHPLRSALFELCTRGSCVVALSEGARGRARDAVDAFLDIACGPAPPAHVLAVDPTSAPERSTDVVARVMHEAHQQLRGALRASLKGESPVDVPLSMLGRLRRARLSDAQRRNGSALHERVGAFLVDGGPGVPKDATADRGKALPPTGASLYDRVNMYEAGELIRTRAQSGRPVSLLEDVNPVQMLLLAASLSPTPDHVVHWVCLGYVTACAQASVAAAAAAAAGGGLSTSAPALPSLSSSSSPHLSEVLRVVVPFVRRAEALLRLLVPVVPERATVSGSGSSSGSSSSGGAVDAMMVISGTASPSSSARVVNDDTVLAGFRAFIVDLAARCARAAVDWSPGAHADSDEERRGGGGGEALPADVRTLLRALAAGSSSTELSMRSLAQVCEIAAAVLPGLPAAAASLQLAAGSGASTTAPAAAAAATTATSAHVSRMSLIDLPDRFDVLYDRLSASKCKNPACLTKRIVSPALCLVCGLVVCAGSDCCRDKERRYGECTTHAAECSGGAGIFLMGSDSRIVLLRKKFAAYFASPYVDVHGEQDIGLSRGRPLMLSKTR